jgi:hypothetical protein
MIVDKFDPNPILININKLKPYRFEDNVASRGLKSSFKRGKDISNTEKRFHVMTLEMHKI